MPAMKELPAMKDLTTENITDNVRAINSQCPNPRIRYIMERLVTHLHDFARETRLSTEEWMYGLGFLKEVGQISNELRHEFILLSDTLGLSALVDSIDHPRTMQSTEGTVLGPFHTHDALTVDNGYAIHKDPDGTPLLVVCTVKDTNGNPMEDVKVDVWEGDSHGNYDVQYAERDGPDGRGVLYTDQKGVVWFKAVKPVSYPIPMDGPVYHMLQTLHRHPYRPGHVHFMLDKKGYDKLITALYPRGDPYEASDPVFGVKESLIVDLTEVTDQAMADEYSVDVGTALLQYEFVMVSEQDALKMRKEEAIKAIQKMGGTMEDFQGLPILDVD